MYMMNGGSKPVGEVYLTPPNGKNTKMVMHYYDGTEITLAEFKTKETTAQPGSIESRIRNCEQHIKRIEEYLLHAISEHNRVQGTVEGNRVYEKLPEFTGSVIEPKDDSNNDRYNTEYHLENYDHWR